MPWHSPAWPVGTAFAIALGMNGTKTGLLGGLKGERGLMLFGVCAVGLSIILAFAFVAQSTDDDPRASAAASTTTDAPSTSKPTPPRSIGFGTLGRSIGSLAIVVLMMVGLATVAARWLKRGRLRPSGQRVLEVLDAVPLGPKRQVYVLSAYGRRLVVAAAGEHVSLLAEFADEELAVITAAVEGGNSASSADFETMLEGSSRRHASPARRLEATA